MERTSEKDIQSNSKILIYKGNKTISQDGYETSSKARNRENLWNAPQKFERSPSTSFIKTCDEIFRSYS